MNTDRISLKQWMAMEGIEGAEALYEWAVEVDGTCPALCVHGCDVEPDGTCEHGCPSVLIAMGVI